MGRLLCLFRYKHLFHVLLLSQILPEACDGLLILPQHMTCEKTVDHVILAALPALCLVHPDGALPGLPYGAVLLDLKIIFEGLSIEKGKDGGENAFVHKRHRLGPVFGLGSQPGFVQIIERYFCLRIGVALYKGLVVQLIQAQQGFGQTPEERENVSCCNGIS